MSDYIYASDGELYHYGVPGMKWGVRKKQEYRRDKRVVQFSKVNARINSRWSEVYDREERYQSKRVNKRANKELRKRGVVSKKTKIALEDTKKLKSDRDLVYDRSQRLIREAQSKVEQFNKKYADKPIKDLETYTKKGRTYARQNAIMDDASSYVLRKTSYVDAEGNKRHTYVPTRITTYYV